MRVQKEAKEVLDAVGMLTPEGVKAVLDMDKHLRSKESAPNGSAVILSCDVLIRELVRMKLTRSGYDEWIKNCACASCERILPEGMILSCRAS